MRIDNITNTHTTAPEGSTQEAQLKKACKEFEAIFTGMMLKAMRKSVSKNDLFGSSKQEELFTDMLDNKIAEDAATGSSSGIADMLYRQLSTKFVVNPSKEER